MSEIDTKALREIAAEAHCAPGVWWERPIRDAMTPQNARLVVAGMNALPDLLDAADERDRLRAEVAELRSACSHHAPHERVEELKARLADVSATVRRRDEDVTRLEAEVGRLREALRDMVEDFGDSAGFQTVSVIQARDALARKEGDRG